MSEYQYYEFCSIHKPLSHQARQEMQALYIPAKWITDSGSSWIADSGSSGIKDSGSTGSLFWITRIVDPVPEYVIQM